MSTKNKTLQRGIVQGLVFNFILLSILLFAWFNYFYPEYLKIENKKIELEEKYKKYEILKSKWLQFEKFNKLHSSLWKEKISNNISLKNTLNQFNKEDYDKNFINTWSGYYLDFFKKQEKEINIKKLEQEKSGVLNVIKKILPYYTEDSSIAKGSLTDFKFINYIENILNNFNLQYKWVVWIKQLSAVNTFNSLWHKKEIKTQNQLEWEIYSFVLNFDLTGKKKNIIDFIYFIENSWNISIWDSANIVIKKASSKNYFFNNDGLKIKNNFSDISNYFKWNEKIYDNLFIEIETIKLKDYLDSSKLPTHYNKWKTFISFIKWDNNQINEKYNINISLKFYVKGQPIYKIKDFIKNISVRHKKLTSIINVWIQYWEKNKANLGYSQKISLKKLKSYNLYLKNINKNIKWLSDIKKQLWNRYKQAKSYSDVFDEIDKNLDVYLKKISENIYQNYKK